ncbi:protein asteroid-like [Aphidius gifuensis]|uniref:protein asteroid-like n=1 Tax=Aphidius gifuensis TaxID=684658 RepID=UPI001CDB705D|nr:protein asteroid-like [Aphidius gifuensis]
MGIRGLTTYIEKNSDDFYETFLLQNTKLVIDGWNLSNRIYRNLSNCNCAFGGDYYQFAKSIEIFFEELIKCNVTPIVILDGGYEKKKESKILSKAKKILDDSSNWIPASQDNDKFSPILASDVFKNVMKKMNIKFFMCPFEADDIIVALARIYECPVLSYDSDFCIGKAMYIPFDTLEADMLHNKYGFMKKCKIYKVEKLLRQFPGLDVSLLPLASVLIGNDYVKAGTFDEFFNQKQQYYMRQPKIALIFNWLKNYSLNTAVGIIVNRIHPEKREKMIKLIENIINSSTASLPTYMLEPLELTPDILDNQVTKFKFDERDFLVERNSHAAKFNEDFQEDYNYYEDSDDDNDDVDNSFNLTTKEFINSWPKWFLEEYLLGEFSSSFIMMMSQQMCLMKTQIENFDFPSSGEMSIPIVKAIFSLLIPKNKSESTLDIMLREKYNLVKRSFNVKRSIIGLEELRQIDIIKRKEFIDQVLGINKNDKLDEMPGGWQLYIATILFWMRQKVVPTRTTDQLTCLLLSMLIGVIDQHMGSRTSVKGFDKINDEIEKIIMLKKTQKTNTNLNSEEDMTVIEALKLVTQNDCIVASQYFMDNFKMNDKLISNPRKFDRTVVHVFAQFQSSLERVMKLNALLGDPYPSVCPSEFFHGTLLYNVHDSLKERADVVTHIQEALEYSPDLFRVFKLLHQKIFTTLKIEIPKKQMTRPIPKISKEYEKTLFFPNFSK